MYQLLQVTAVRNSKIHLTKTKSLSLKAGTFILATKVLLLLGEMVYRREDISCDVEPEG